MRPITDNPWKQDRPERNKKMESEVREFLASGSKFAEMWQDESIQTQRNIQLYQRECRRMKVDNVSFHQLRGMVIAVRDQGNSKEWRTI